MAATKAESALAWAARGFRVFPLRPGTNEPYAGSDWVNTATTDAEAIKQEWLDRPFANVGVLTNDLIVLDVDCKDGKPGFESLIELDLPLDTLTVRTPSGGLHLYFAGPNRANGVNRLGQGLDVRSFHGYVVAPGSSTAKGCYELVTDAPLREAPDRLLAMLDAPRERRQTQTPVAELDTAWALQRATEYLSAEAPAPPEGGRNHALFKVATAVKDYGVTEIYALNLICEYWNTRLGVPLEREEIEKTVGSAYANGQLPAGCAHPSADFAGVKISVPPIETKPEAPAAISAFLRFQPLPDIAELGPRPWIVKRALMRRAVTTLVAPGGVGKSSLQLAFAAHLALGMDFAGFELANKGKPVRSIVVNVEDEREEMAKRLLAVCVEFGLDHREVAKHVILLPGSEYFFKVADGGKKIETRTKELKALIEFMFASDVAVLMVDPLLETHDVEVSDNQGLKTIMSLYRSLAQKANAAVFIAHHTSKGGQRQRAGDAEAAMGASAIINSSRIAFTLFDADEDDGERFGLPPATLPFYVRLDDAKMNMSLRRGTPTWFRRQGVDLICGDSIGVLTPADLREDAMSETRRLASTIEEEFKARNIVSATTYECVKLLITADPLFAEIVRDSSHKTMQRKIEKALAVPFKLDGGNVLKFVVEKASEASPARNIVVLD